MTSIEIYDFFNDIIKRFERFGLIKLMNKAKEIREFLFNEKEK